MYLTLIPFEFEQDFRRYLDLICTAGELRYREWCFPFRYDRFIETLQALPAEVVVRSYDTASRGDLMADFLATCGIDRALFAGASLPHENRRSPLWDGMRAFHRTRFGRSDLGAVFAAAERVLPRGPTYHAHERARLSECFCESNEVVCARWGLALDPLRLTDTPETPPLTSLSDLFSTEFHTLLAAVGNLDHGGSGSLDEELRRQRECYERTLSWRVTAPLRALHARFRTRSRRGTSA